MNYDFYCINVHFIFHYFLNITAIILRVKYKILINNCVLKYTLIKSKKQIINYLNKLK